MYALVQGDASSLKLFTTSDLDLLTANRLISQVFSSVEKLLRDFEAVKIL